MRGWGGPQYKLGAGGVALGLGVLVQLEGTARLRGWWNWRGDGVGGHWWNWEGTGSGVAVKLGGCGGWGDWGVVGEIRRGGMGLGGCGLWGSQCTQCKGGGHWGAVLVQLGGHWGLLGLGWGPSTTGGALGLTPPPGALPASWAGPSSFRRGEVPSIPVTPTPNK